MTNVQNNWVMEKKAKASYFIYLSIICLVMTRKEMCVGPESFFLQLVHVAYF